jgi:hypothetical protein
VGDGVSFPVHEINVLMVEDTYLASVMEDTLSYVVTVDEILASIEESIVNAMAVPEAIARGAIHTDTASAEATIEDDTVRTNIL